MTEAARLDRAVKKVVAAQNCSGCGACTLLDPSLTMQLDPAGYQRPVRTAAPPRPVPGASHTFAAVCPGRRIGSPRPAEATVHPTMGPVVSAWEAWATDPDIRHRGSSGGALTALSAWLVEAGEVAAFAGVRVDQDEPRRTVPVSITTREEALVSAGSRYAPVSTLSQPAALTSGGLIGKPCEIAAARALTRTTPAAETPLMLSFFCAGTPSQRATDSLVSELGVPSGAPLADLWYRGRGWPGHFTATPVDGEAVRTTYDDSWGAHLGKTTQWRCKICPDGVGESADIAAADFWHTDERGYPLFEEGDGCSAVLARTPRGHDVLTRAFAAGVLVGRPLDVDQLAAVQPLQVARRRTLLGRLAGTLGAGRAVPRYSGFSLLRLALGNPRQSLRTAKGSFGRVRAQSRTELAA